MSPVPPFVDRSQIVAANPTPEFARAVDQGYQFFYRIESNGDLFPDLKHMRELTVEVRQDGQQIACANFLDNGYEFNSQNVEVDPQHRRRKIATAIYVFAEKCIGKTLDNLWDQGGHSDEAKALWNQPNRPFGPKDR